MAGIVRVQAEQPRRRADGVQESDVATACHLTDDDVRFRLIAGGQSALSGHVVSLESMPSVRLSHRVAPPQERRYARYHPNMAYSVFISYSTKNLHIANHVRAALTIPGVNVFIAEYSVPASAPLNAFIEMGLRSCDLFVLLWSRNSKASDYVPQEIGIARGCNKVILPIVLEEGLAVPGFASDLKYLPAYKDYGQALSWLQLDLSPKLRQTVKTHFSLNGELSHGIVSTEVHEGV